MSEVFKLENVELYWPFLYERNQLSNKFQVDLSNLTDEQIEKIEASGVSLRNKQDDRNAFVTCKSSKYEITPYNKNGEVIPAEVKVGNGSRANLMVKPYAWKSPTGQKGISLGIVKMVITDLNEYTGGGVDVSDLVESEDTL
mgnify:CR=1 FL=1